ncbi:14114_t:CDS:2 [Dentiscutata erythropus]|uniref:14114_t:CDS:1 n=1 Tax=Dentiscutata erythropus TaxID=1348616 RepID=A0A9N9N796_9GLOM|nr:14114_t:CDS:2 [Dentiscutata erythropus]
MTLSLLLAGKKNAKTEISLFPSLGLSIILDSLSFELEGIEAYIAKTNKYPNKNQIYRTGKGTIKDYSGFTEDYYDIALTNLLTLSGIVKATSLPEVKEYALIEFYKWIDYSDITEKNCLPDLDRLLIGVHESLKGKGKKILEDTKTYLTNTEQPPKESFINVFSTTQKFVHETRELKEGLKDQKFDKSSKFHGNSDKERRTFEMIEAKYVEAYLSNNFYFQ